VSLRERSSDERRAFIQSITAETDSDLVEFLAQEVLDQQTSATRNFLLSTSVLRQIHPELAASISGLEDGARVLSGLEDGGLFTFRLDDGLGTYRYHGLFRDFLLRRLTLERSEGEVAALHIHAASYFETHSLWPDAIHHYMEAGLQPQAARLIAKFGEDLVSTGRLPIVEDWLMALPARTVHENARLSLLHGEMLGVSGRWKEALNALTRARAYFTRKGDHRMEAVACSKLSSVHNNYGNSVESATLAREGLELAPPDAHATRIRLRGNLAVTAGFLESFEVVVRECKRLAVESTERGYEQYAAIAHHNLGAVLRDVGSLEESLNNLVRAARYWDASPTNPFADNSELVLTLIALGRTEEAKAVADSAVERTRPWKRANAEARLGRAAVHLATGAFAEGIDLLKDLAELGDVPGAAKERVLALLAEALYLTDGSDGDLRLVADQLQRTKPDPRLGMSTAVTNALIAHRFGGCTGACEEAKRAMQRWRAMGAMLVARQAALSLAVLAIDHDVSSGLDEIVTAAGELPSFAGLPLYWLRRMAPHMERINECHGPELLTRLVQADPDYWLPIAISSVTMSAGGARQTLLDAIQMHPSPDTIRLLREVDGADVQEVRRKLVQQTAARIYLRSFGSLAIHRDSWDNAPSLIGRRRIRLLLGVLIANFDGGLTRDEVIEVLWPESDPGSAVNSLNQTVFQLRRLIEPGYREGDSPQYVISNVDVVRLNRELVTTDLSEFRSLRERIESTSDPEIQRRSVHDAVDLIRGEYLGDLKYEDWVAHAQLSVHAEIRSLLLPIARGEVLAGLDEWALKAGWALTALDEFDEEAQVAMIRHLAASGRRNQARSLASGYATRVREELEEDPSEAFLLAAQMTGAPV
jgi:DNA-binding SARP family transcriptional activator/tetratricopeptide (TPR) repeat protein